LFIADLKETTETSQNVELSESLHEPNPLQFTFVSAGSDVEESDVM